MTITEEPARKKKGRKRLATLVAKIAAVSGDIDRMSDHWRQTNQSLIEDIVSLEPDVDPEDLADWTNTELDDYLRRIECDVSLWGEPSSRERPGGAITIAAVSDVMSATYSPTSLSVLPGESFTSATITCGLSLSREQLADLCRVLKPGATITIAAC